MIAGGFGLSQEDLDRGTARFGVADDQVRRDHAISHILGGISNRLRDDVIFFGGTALSRTHLVHARLSEDIDLIALGDRREIAERLVTSINTALLRTHGRLSWLPSFTARMSSPRSSRPPLVSRSEFSCSPGTAINRGRPSCATSSSVTKMHLPQR